MWIAPDRPIYVNDVEDLETDIRCENPRNDSETASERFQPSAFQVLLLVNSFGDAVC